MADTKNFVVFGELIESMDVLGEQNIIKVEVDGDIYFQKEIPITSESIYFGLNSISVTLRTSIAGATIIAYLDGVATVLTNNSIAGSIYSKVYTGLTNGAIYSASIGCSAYPYKSFYHTETEAMPRSVSIPVFATCAEYSYDTIRVRFTNNNSFSVVIYYEANDSSPDLYSITLGANSTSGIYYIDGLAADTTHTIYAYSYDPSEGRSSSIATATASTPPQPRVLLNPVFATCSAYDSEHVRLRFTNNNSFSVRVYFAADDATPDIDYVTVSANSTSEYVYMLDDFIPGSTHTIYAQSYDPVEGGYSAVINSNVTLPTGPRTVIAPVYTYSTLYAPTMLYLKFRNDNAFPVKVYFELGNATPTYRSMNLAANSSSGYTLYTGLTPDATQTMYARSYDSVEGGYSPVSSVTVTTEPVGYWCWMWGSSDEITDYADIWLQEESSEDQTPEFALWWLERNWSTQEVFIGTTAIVYDGVFWHYFEVLAY